VARCNRYDLSYSSSLRHIPSPLVSTFLFSLKSSRSLPLFHLTLLVYDTLFIRTSTATSSGINTTYVVDSSPVKSNRLSNRLVLLCVPKPPRCYSRHSSQFRHIFFDVLKNSYQLYNYFIHRYFGLLGNHSV
jgi:hypothetical protein